MNGHISKQADIGGGDEMSPKDYGPALNMTRKIRHVTVTRPAKAAVCSNIRSLNSTAAASGELENTQVDLKFCG